MEIKKQEKNTQTLTLSCSANEHTEMKLKIYLSEAWMCSEFGYQRPMSNKKGLNFQSESIPELRISLINKCFRKFEEKLGSKIDQTRRGRKELYQNV